MPGKAISLVVAGGVVAAFLGPQIGLWGRDWIAGELFVGAYLAQAGLSLAALFLLSRLKLPKVATTHAGTPRPLRVLLRQPDLRVAIFGAATGYAVMIMVMTATPLAILGCGLPGSNVTPVIQWHVVGMFAPSFFTGALIERYGAPRIMQIGFVLLLGNVVLALSGVEFLHFLSALVLLGVGWNFAFIGGTALLTQTYQPAERLKVQAVNEFAVFGFAALATLSAGWLYDRFGWGTLNLAVIPILLAALIASHRHRTALAPGGGAGMNPAEYDAWYDTPRGRWIGETEYALAARQLECAAGRQPARCRLRHRLVQPARRSRRSRSSPDSIRIRIGWIMRAPTAAPP